MGLSIGNPIIFKNSRLNSIPFGKKNHINNYIGENFFREVVNNETGMRIEITKKGIKETLGSGNRFQNLPRKLKEYKVATIRSLPILIQNSRLVEDEVPNSHGNAQIYAYFLSSVKINNTELDVRINVRKTSAKNKFWLHIIDIKEKNSQLLSPSET